VQAGKLSREVETLHGELEQARMRVSEVDLLRDGLEKANLAMIQLSDCNSDYQQQIQEVKEDNEKYQMQLEEMEKNKEDLRQEVDRRTSESSLLEKQVDSLREQNAKLVGHNNPKQKIQHLVKIKEENNHLLKQKASLEEGVRQRDNQLRRLLESSANKPKSDQLTPDHKNSLLDSVNLNSSIHQQEPDTMNLSILSKLQEVFGNKENVNANNSTDCSFDEN
jgi:chromosome segregation ATPase